MTYPQGAKAQNARLQGVFIFIKLKLKRSLRFEK
jgi:hypothetical protein